MEGLVVEMPERTPQCNEVWERRKSGDHVVWGYCKRPRGHVEPCGPDVEVGSRRAGDVKG